MHTGRLASLNSHSFQLPLCRASRTPLSTCVAGAQEAISHGYNIVTNKGFYDKDPAPLPPARTQPKPTLSEKLGTSSSHFWNTRTMQTQQRLGEAARPASEGAPFGGAVSARASRAPVVPVLDIAKAKPAPLEMTAGSSVRTGGFK